VRLGWWRNATIDSYLARRAIRGAGLTIAAVVMAAASWAVAAPAAPGSVAVLGLETDLRAAGAARFRPLAALDTWTAVTVVIDGKAVAADARAGETVGGLLRSAGLEVGPGDRVSVPLDRPLVAGLRVVLDRGFPVTVVDGGTPVALRAQPGTVGAFLDQAGISLGPKDRLEVAAEGPMVPGAVIGIERVAESTIVETVPIAAPIETVREPDQYVGWYYTAATGAPGEARVTFLVRFVNGVEAERSIVASEPVLRPVAQVVHVGVKPKPAPPAPAEIEAIIQAAASKYAVDPAVLLRVAYCESRYDPLAYNGVLGASGLFQIIPGTWRANAPRAGYGGASVWDPVANANVAAFMFANSQAGQWACK
jgi:uncharacterized protein YabE (DUF348 family)